jgi:PIN domain nuclease of toxin-antitoxin system
MKLLLDTHIILWALDNNPKLSEKARKLILDPANEIYCSTASLWELQIKHMIHPDVIPEPNLVFEFCQKAGYEVLNISVLEVFGIAELKQIHKDPFDRILLSQAKVLGMKLLTSDRIFEEYKEECVVLV